MTLLAYVLQSLEHKEGPHYCISLILDTMLHVAISYPSIPLLYHLSINPKLEGKHNNIQILRVCSGVMFGSWATKA